jgi:hypothetical protein
VEIKTYYDLAVFAGQTGFRSRVRLGLSPNGGRHSSGIWAGNPKELWPSLQIARGEPGRDALVYAAGHDLGKRQGRIYSGQWNVTERID